MKINLDFSINSGAYAILYTLGFFGVLLLTKWSPSVGQNAIGIEGAWTVGFGAALAKRHVDNRLDLDAAKNNVGPELNQIKIQAEGPCRLDKE